MRDDGKFALVLEASAAGAGPDAPFGFGVCLVDGDSARTLFTDFAGLDRAVGDYPCVPSIYGRVPGIVSFEAEMEAIDILTSAAAGMREKYGRTRPPGYRLLAEPLSGGLEIAVSGGRADIELAEWAAAALGWHAGDRVALALSPCSRRLMLITDREGAALVHATRPGWLSADRSWPLPHHVRAEEGIHRPGITACDGVIEFDIPAAAPAPPAVTLPPPAGRGLPPAPTPEYKDRLPVDYKWGLLLLASMGYAALAAVLVPG